MVSSVKVDRTVEGGNMNESLSRPGRVNLKNPHVCFCGFVWVLVLEAGPHVA